MKISTFALTGVLALATAASGFAQATTIRIVGSSAYRAAVNDAIRSILQPGFTCCNSKTAAAGTPSSSDIAGASQSLFVGTMSDTAIYNTGNRNAANTYAGSYSGDGQVVIKTFFSGSVSGVGQVVEGQTGIAFIADGTQPGGTNGTAYPGVGVGGSYTAEASAPAPDICWTDAPYGADGLALQKADSTADSKNIANSGLQEAGTLSHGGAQGLVFFELLMESLGNNNASAPISNLTTDQLATLITAGNISMAQINGDSLAADKEKQIFLIGRSEDSGSRVNVFTDAFEGFNNGTLNVVQYLPTFSSNVTTEKDTGAPSTFAGHPTVNTGGAGATLASLAPWPGSWAINYLPTAKWTQAGHAGFVAGGDVANALKAIDPVANVPVTFPSGSTYTPTSTYVVSYLGGNDANSALATAVPNQPIRLNYNGNGYSQAAVLNGQYGLWGYEHTYYFPNTQGTVQGDVGDAVADMVYSTTAEDNNSLGQSDSTRAAAGIFMNLVGAVSRGSTGAPATESYHP